MARTVWSDQTLSADADLVKVEANIASWGVGSLSNKHALAKEEIGRLLRMRYQTLKTTIDPKEAQEDGVTSTGTSSNFTSALALFTSHKVSTSDRLWIEEEDDKGVYTISSVVSETALTISPTPSEVNTGLSYYIEPEVLDFIKNPLILKPAAVFLTLHYSAMELINGPGDYYDAKQQSYSSKFKETFAQLVPDLILDIDQDHVISTGERKPGITGGHLLR